MTDISNGHQQPPALYRSLTSPLADRLTVNRIVKIACVFAVDSHQGYVRKVYTVHSVLGPHFLRQSSGQRNTRLRKLVRDRILAHGNFNLHSGIVHLTKNFFDATHRLPKKCRWLDQFYDYYLTWFSDTGSSLGDEDILPVALVLRCDQPHTTFLQKTTNNGLRRSLHNLSNTSFGTPFAVAANNAHFYAIFVQYRPHFIRRQIDVWRTIVARYKSMAIAMTLNYSFNFVQQAAGLA